MVLSVRLGAIGAGQITAAQTREGTIFDAAQQLLGHPRVSAKVEVL